VTVEAQGAATYLSVITGGYQYINPIDFSLCKRYGFELASLRLCRVQNDPFLAVDEILLLLARQHA
jgi:hypothetical protein